ncbi:uncharacterized protein [Oryza sativa Japonica Group]|uniref:uncharacterized protein isoform X5 n=1 Tax=Oryza sativa subsp. japonica TaxID=39947 RepID=UPI000775558A|nr:hypothetical protein DAI22_04g256400 [Oryza sativa Japonica Group]
MAEAAGGQPEFVEVRCAGCGETLEVEPGLTEFACPDCGTHQALPPELMPPPPPRPRRALPIPGRGPPPAAVLHAPVPVPVQVPAPARMPCGGCCALLSVPAGLVRFACPVCAAELVVDGGRLRLYFASPAAPTVSVVAPPPAGVTLTASSLRHRPESQIERHHPIRSEQIPAQCSIRSVPREETFSSFRNDSPAAVQHTLARKEPVNHSIHRGESCNETLDKTTARSSSRKARLQAGVESIYIEKLQPERPIQESTPQAQACPPSNSVRGDHAQGQQPLVDISSREQRAKNVSSTMEREKAEPLNQASELKKAQAGKTIGCPKRKRSSKNAGENKRKNKGFPSSPNEGLYLRRSKRLTKQPEQPINDDPVQQPAASPNQYNSDPPDIDRLIANLCPSPSPQCQMPQACSSESGNADASVLPASSNREMPQAEQSPHRYNQLCPPEVRGTHQLDKSGEQVQPQSPEQVTHAQQQDAYSYHPVLRKYSRKSSGRGRGRRPRGLIEPRREYDRPVLTPNNIDNWDVNPLCPKVSSTITALLKQKYPGSTYLPVGEHGDVPANEELVYRWKHYPAETRAAILNEFLQRYKWAPGREAECLKIFQRRAVKQFTGLLCEEKRRVRAELAAVQKAKKASGSRSSNSHAESEEEDATEEPKDNQTEKVNEDEDPLLWKPFPPAWMHPNWWERLCEYWAKEEVLQMSLKYRKNRFVGGRAHHTSGSRSFAMQRQLMVIENGGKPVSELEIFNKTHKFNGGTGEFVSEKAKRIVEGFKKRMEEAGDKPADPDAAWIQQVGGRNRGRYYGLTGTIDKAKIAEIAKSIPGKRGQQKFSQEEVQQMINHALQGLNQSWEEKFKSLEQSVRGAPLLGVDHEHAPGSSAAGGDVQQDQSKHQDESDKQHVERRQSARHHDDDDDDDDEDYEVEEEEVVSTSD